MVRRQDECMERHALTDEAKWAIITDMFPGDLEKHKLLNADRFDTQIRGSPSGGPGFYRANGARVRAHGDW